MLTLSERAQLQEILRMVNNDRKHSDWSKEFGCQFNSDENGLNTTVMNDRQLNSEKHPWSDKKVETLLGDTSSDDESIQTFHVDKEDLVASEDDSVEGNLFMTPDPSIDILESDVTDEPVEEDKDYDFIGKSIQLLPRILVFKLMLGRKPSQLIFQTDSMTSL